MPTASPSASARLSMTIGIDKCDGALPNSAGIA
jgi:hypothetical protein